MKPHHPATAACLPVAITLAAAGAALGQETAIPCTITDGSDLNQTALCEVLDEGASLEFIGTIEENDVMFVSLADRYAGTAILIGAGTFFLAQGEAEITDTAMVWPNGYAVRLTD